MSQKQTFTCPGCKKKFHWTRRIQISATPAPAEPDSQPMEIPIVSAPAEPPDHSHLDDAITAAGSSNLPGCATTMVFHCPYDQCWTPLQFSFLALSRLAFGSPQCRKKNPGPSSKAQRLWRFWTNAGRTAYWKHLASPFKINAWQTDCLMTWTRIS